MKILYAISNWLILRLAGKHTVVVNAYFKNGTIVNTNPYSLITKNFIDGPMKEGGAWVQSGDISLGGF